MKFKTFSDLSNYLIDNHSNGESISISVEDFRSFQLNQSENDLFYRNIFEDVPCTISVVNKDLEYLKVNGTLAGLCGISSDEFIGKKVGFYTDNKFFLNFIRKVFESPRNSSSKEIKTVINNEDKFFWVSAYKINNDEECVLIGVDITDLKHLEGQLQFSEKLTALGEMVAGIVHDIKNPLTVISASSQMLKKTERLNDEKILKIAERVGTTSERILKIVNSVKVFVRTGEEDPLELKDMLLILNEAQDICNHKLHENGIKFSIVNPEDSFSAEVNETKIFQVFVNLISNACDELSEKGYANPWVEVQFLPQEKKILFIDCGNGIDESVQSKIFESFFTTKGIGVGSGLGLSNCKRIMQEHGGDISVDNSNTNTAFIVSFLKS